MVTVHWYKATKETPNTPESLLDEGPVRVEMDNLRQLVQVANSFGKPLRVAEANTISNSGRLGVSNVFAGGCRREGDHRGAGMSVWKYRGCYFGARHPDLAVVLEA